MYNMYFEQSMSSFAKLAFDENVAELDSKESETQRLILLVVKKRLSVVNTAYGAHVMLRQDLGD